MRKMFLSLTIAFALVAMGTTCGNEVPTDETARRTPDTTTPPPTIMGSLTGDRLVSALRRGGFNIYFRHAATDPAPDDADPVDFSDCDTQRNLSREGRRQARAIGRAIDALDIPIGRVLSSPFCRTLDTARLAFGKATREPSLENLENADTETESDARTRGLRRLLSTRPDGATNNVLVAHGFNITAAADVTLAEGEAAIFRPNNKNFEFVATVAPEEWDKPN